MFLQARIADEALVAQFAIAFQFGFGEIELGFGLRDVVRGLRPCQFPHPGVACGGTRFGGAGLGEGRLQLLCF